MADAATTDTASVVVAVCHNVCIYVHMYNTNIPMYSCLHTLCMYTKLIFLQLFIFRNWRCLNFHTILYCHWSVF